MVLVRNKKQKTEWEIEDPAMLKRMRADPEHYEILGVTPSMPDQAQGKGQVQEKGVEPDKTKEKQPVKPGK